MFLSKVEIVLNRCGMHASARVIGSSRFAGNVHDLRSSTSSSSFNVLQMSYVSHRYALQYPKFGPQEQGEMSPIANKSFTMPSIPWLTESSLQYSWRLDGGVEKVNVEEIWDLWNHLVRSTLTVIPKRP